MVTNSRTHDEAEHRRAANRAVAISALGLAATGGVELAIALYTGSVALLGDALHNLADVSTSAVVFVGFRVSKRPPSQKYSHGYERAEDLAGLAIALVIWGSAVFAGYETWLKFVSRTPTIHLGAGIAAAGVGIAGNFLVARYKARVGRRIQSATMVAEAKHSWLDMMSSGGALLGLVGVALGFGWADAVAGAVVTLFICHVGWEVTSEMIHHLMDGVDPEHLEAAAQAVRALPGVSRVAVRGRWMGRSLIIEVEGTLDGSTSLSSASGMRDSVEHAVREAVEEARVIRWIPAAFTAAEDF